MIKRSLQFDILAVISLLAFSLSLITQSSLPSLVKYTTEWRTDIWLIVCSQYAIPLLIMVVGFGFLGAEYDFSLESLSVIYRFSRKNKYNQAKVKSKKAASNHKEYRGLIARAVIACLIWWLLVGLVYMSQRHTGDYDFDTMLDSMADVLKTPYFIAFYQLVAILFIFYPLFKKIASDKKLTAYAAILFFAFSIVNKLIIYLPFGKYINMFTSQIGWNNFTIYGFYLFVGVLLTKIRLKWYIRMIVYSASIISTAALYCIYVFYTHGELGKGFSFSIIPLLSTIQACSLIIAAGRISEAVNYHPRASVVLHKLAENTYIYIAVFSMLYISLSGYFELSGVSFGIKMLIELFAFFVLSSALCWIIRKIPHIGLITT